ncbi:MAG: Na(+)-translocating NADH-quinone reductase subunit A [Myxococcaceae bacterium]|nr:Na(+)-translocating NADH-quinone reductase subunit A [Myxococcaceae bacterium]
MSPAPVIVSRGLDLPITGAPRPEVQPGATVPSVALLARDFVGLQVRVLVEPGARVRLGQPVWVDRTRPELRFTAPGSGVVAAVHRGEKRALQSTVVNLEEGAEPMSFEAFSPAAGNDGAATRALLLESGLWTALRTRPFSRVPRPDATPKALFVTAVDTHPLAPDVELALKGREADFERGLSVLKQLCGGPLFLCRAPGSSLGPGSSGAQVAEFGGKHPAGTVGFHIHTLMPVTRGVEVWHVGAQDVARIGHLFATGSLDVTQVVSLGGPRVKTPRLLRTRLGAHLGALLAGELHEGESRVISGSVLHGDVASGDAFGFLGRFHQQISVVAEGRERRFLGWLGPGLSDFSTIPTFLSALAPGRRFGFDTNTHGGRRAMVPIGMYERVMPMDLMPTHLLRALTVGDVEWAEELGALELDEEDLALCSYVCPGKLDYGAALRKVLSTLEAEG